MFRKRRDELKYGNSLSVPRHFIPKGKNVTSYQSLHPCALHPKRYFIPVHFIPSALHTKPLLTKWYFIPSALHTKCTSYQATSYQMHFIPSALHTKCTSYQASSYQLHLLPSHFIPSTLHPKYFIPSDEIYGRDRKNTIRVRD